jgi:uncharacterized protein
MEMDRKSGDTGIVVSHDALHPETLRGLIEEFVSRDGTDSGYTGQDLDQRVARVRRQLVRGSALIVFDPVTETANIVSAEGSRPG